MRVIGERVFIEALTGEPVSSTQVKKKKKKKIWDNVAKNLRTVPGGVATWEGVEADEDLGKPHKKTSITGVGLGDGHPNGPPSAMCNS